MDMDFDSNNMMMHNYKDLAHAHHCHKMGGRYLVENHHPSVVVDNALFTPHSISIMEFRSFE